MGFGFWDQIIVAVYLLGVTLLGALAGRRLSSTQDYFLAGRQAPWWLVTFSIVATETSTLTFVGVPGIAYVGNFSFLHVVIGYLVGRVLVAWFLVPAYMGSGLQTSYELLQGRLGSGARRSASGVFCVTRLLGDGVRLFSACIVLKEVLDRVLGAWAGNELVAVAVVGGLTLVYTFCGGMRAVLWTDLVQLVLYLAGGVLVFFLAIHATPAGFVGIWEQAAAAGKLRIFTFSTEPGVYPLIGGLVGGALLSMATHGTDQLIVQRVLSCRSIGAARTAMVASGIVVLGQMFFFLLLGMVLWAFYTGKGVSFDRSDAVLPHFLVHHLPSGLSGLIVAAAFAAAMSTLSGSLNSLASATVNDFYRPLTGDRHGDRHYLRAGKWATLGWGLLLMAMALPVRNSTGLLDAAMAIAGITSGGVLGLFLLSRFKARGGVVGMFSAIGVCFGLWLMQKFDGPALHWTWLCPVGVGVTFLVAGFSRRQETD